MLSAITTSKAILPVNTYKVNNAVTVYDKTNGIARLVFLGICDCSNKPTYEVLIKDKKLTYLNSQSKFSRKPLMEIIAISFELEGSGFVKITIIKKDINDQRKWTLYADLGTSKPAYIGRAYRYPPNSTVTQEKACRMVQALSVVKPIVAVCNRHGVAAFCLEKRGNHALYHAKPDDEKLNKVEYAYCFSEGGSFFAKSKDLVFYFSLNVVNIQGRMMTTVNVKIPQGELNEEEALIVLQNYEPGFVEKPI